MKKEMGILLVLCVLSAGCTTTQKGAGIGAGAGALLGGIVGHQTGDGVAGAAIGAGAGGLAGALIGEQMDKKFCPVCGKRYTSGEKVCPIDGTELKDIENK